MNKCCSKPYNWVYLTQDEITALSEASRKPEPEFVTTRRSTASGLTLRTLNLPCQFLAVDGSCSVYGNRPLICRLFPFYPDPLVEVVSLLPIECDVRLKFVDPVSPEGWSVNDYDEMIQKWIQTIWDEARH